MKGHLFEKKERFSIRKFSVGVCSALIGLAFLGTGAVSADETVSTSEQPLETSSVATEDVNHLVREAGVYTADAALPTADPAKPATEALTPEASPTSTEASSTTTDHPAVSETEKPKATAEKVADLPTNEEKQLRPKEVKFDTWDDLLKWEPGKRVDDDMNRASVPLASRFQGKQINEQANPEAKIQALSNMNSKAKDHASVGGEEFKAYAFDYWQYLDSMVFWEGLVPSADVIDAAHRNGVPIYGTIFYNWSSSIKDQEHFAETLKEDSEGSKTFPIARKLVELAKYYGFDGYFINQETTGNLVEPLGPKLRDFLLYTKEYAKSLNYPIKYSWYDAMTYEYGRYHENALGEYNYNFMQPENGENPVDTFFANFNWGKSEVDYSISTAKWIHRNPYDVLAGLELQKGGSYKTNVDWNAILDEHGKLRLSLGLYAPDTITGLGKTGEGYHTHEDLFWTGFQGDPTKGKPADQSWYGMSNLVVDKTPITSEDFNTSFNTGHGKHWFVDGKISKEGEWNYRSVSGYLPTWRWWVEHSEDSTPLKGRYDFDQAYNGGNSLAFEGDLKANSSQNVMLYSTKIPVTETTKLSVSHKGGIGAAAWVAVATKEDYSEYEWKELTPSADWSTQTFDLGGLAGKTIYAVKMFFDHDTDVKDYKFNLGQLSITSNQEKPATPAEVSVRAKRLQNAQEAEAVLNFKGVADADYYEVYEKDGDNWRLLTGSSATTVYLPKVSRSASAQGTTQELKVVAVGKNGVRSEAATTTFDWGMTVKDTSLPKPLAENIVPGATVIDSTFPKTEGGEGIEGMLNGTITSLSDKWSSGQLSGSVDIRLTQPRTVVRWVMDHAGAGGESVNDGLMNTKDFDLYYKDADGQWKLAKEVRGNKAHVTDITLDKPITAQDWRLNVVTSDNGTPWKAIRIYNWKMYEKLDTESINIPMAKAAARSLGNNKVQVGFADVPAGATITVYDNPNSQTPLATLKSEVGGDLASAPLDLTNQSGLLYYRTQLLGKEISNVLAVSVPKDDRRIKSVSLETGPKKTSYTEGEDLDLRGGVLRVQYEGGAEDELIRLTHAGVSVSGFDMHHKGEQNLTLQYLGQPVHANLSVTVTSQDEASPKTILGIEVSQEPKKDYLVGDNLDLSEGRFAVAYSNDTMEEHSFTDEGVEISGYDAQKTGRQTLTLRYQGHEVNFDVLVSPKAALNDEYLKQEITAVQGRQSTVAYTFSSEDKQATLVEKLNGAKAVAENHGASQEDVNQALNELKQAGANLDGNQRYEAARKELESLLESIREKYPKSELIAQAEALLVSQAPTPQAFADMKEQLNKKLAPAAESHHVGSQDPNEVAPTVEALSGLVVETETIAFERQERPNTSLLKGQRQLVQAGVEGQIRRLIEVDSQGNRTLRATEVLKEAVPEITEIGTKVISSKEPTEGVKNLVVNTPKLEVEETSLAFEHQERLNSNLPVGQRQLVQAGVEGQIRRLIEVDSQGNRTLRATEVLKEASPEIVEVGTGLIPANPAPQMTDLPKPSNQPVSDQQKAPKLEVREEKIAFDRQEHENAEMLVGEQRVIIQGRDGLLRHVFEVDENGQRRLRSTEVIQEAIPEIVEIGTKVKTEPAVAPTQEKPAQNTAVKSEEASAQLPNTGTVDTNEVLIAGLASLGLASLALTLKQKKEEED